MVQIRRTKKGTNEEGARKGALVFVGMSGGVDSSVAALLLKEQGFRVTGVHIRSWNKGGCDVREAEDARRVAERIGIPFYVFDMEKEYEERVVRYMIEGYEKGLTPNPDIMCNKEIKFGLFLEKARSLGADRVATGHYARVTHRPDGTHGLGRPRDAKKDQTYFLWTLTEEKLRHILFPLGDLEKNEVRAIARRAGLVTADKKDSQGICFVGNVPLRTFLQTYLKERPGDVLDEKGNVIGTHKGAYFYTIGQRHGFLVRKRSDSMAPHYVVRKDIEKNVLTVAEGRDDISLYRKDVSVRDLHFITEDPRPESGRCAVRARIRHGQPLQRAVLEGSSVRFHDPQQYVAEGQSLVLYSAKGDEVLGGGIIAGDRP